MENDIQQEQDQDQDQDQDNQEQEDIYQVKTEIFEGPLDLLLHLIKTSEIDIYDIPIALITQQYLQYLSFLVIMNLENISEFVEMASTLLLIKSRSLLPVEVEFEEEIEDPRDELISKLLEYQKYKMAAGLLESRSEDAIPFITRDNEPGLFKIEETDESNWKKLSVLDLIGAFADVLNKNTSGEMGFEVLVYNYTVEEKLNSIIDLLKEKEQLNYFDIVRKNMPKLELVCTFLSILELVKKGYISVQQHLIFGDINIFRKVDPDELKKVGDDDDFYFGGSEGSDEKEDEENITDDAKNLFESA